MTANRKKLIADYKSQKVPVGIYAVRCTASGKTWVGASRNLAATRNGLWFTLRQSSPHIDASLRLEWNAFGEDAFHYEVLEQLEDDLPALSISDLLKEKKSQWAAQLAAPVLL